MLTNIQCILQVASYVAIAVASSYMDMYICVA